jgi:hypothetical protein
MRRTIEISMSEKCLGTGRVGTTARSKTRERRAMKGKAAKRTLSKTAIDFLPYRQATDGGVNIP